MHQPSGGMPGQAADIAIQAEQMMYIKQTAGRADRRAHRSDRSTRSTVDSDRDRWFTAEEAKEYGIIDHVISHREQIVTPEDS